MRTNLYKLLLDIYSVFQHNPFIYETGEKYSVEYEYLSVYLT